LSLKLLRLIMTMILMQFRLTSCGFATVAEIAAEYVRLR
jgi:hypothetical protein